MCVCVGGEGGVGGWGRNQENTQVPSPGGINGDSLAPLLVYDVKLVP